MKWISREVQYNDKRFVTTKSFKRNHFLVCRVSHDCKVSIHESSFILFSESKARLPEVVDGRIVRSLRLFFGIYCQTVVVDSVRGTESRDWFRFPLNWLVYEYCPELYVEELDGHPSFSSRCLGTSLSYSSKLVNPVTNANWNTYDS